MKWCFLFDSFSFRRSSIFGSRKRRQAADDNGDDGGDTEVATVPQTRTRTVRVPGQCYVYTQTFSIGWVPWPVTMM